MKTMNEILDSIYTLQEKKKMLIDTYDGQIETLKNLLHAAMTKEDTDRVEFNGAIAFFRSQTSVEIKDWNALMQYVKQNDAFDVLQRRVAPAQLEKRIDAGAHIKGVKITHGVALIVKGKKDAASDE